MQTEDALWKKMYRNPDPAVVFPLKLSTCNVNYLLTCACRRFLTGIKNVHQWAVCFVLLRTKDDEALSVDTDTESHGQGLLVTQGNDLRR